MATFQALQTWIGHLVMFEKFAYPSVTSLLVTWNVLLHITKLCNEYVLPPIANSPQTMVNLEKIYGKACGNMFML